MAAVFHIADPVVTGDRLKSLHRDENEVWIHPESVITPTAWDYIREWRLRVVRDSREPPAADERKTEALVGNKLLQEGRCLQPGRSCGCDGDEFGSGFVEPASCQQCAIFRLQREGKPNAGCEGCNRARSAGKDLEALVGRITDQIFARIGEWPGAG